MNARIETGTDIAMLGTWDRCLNEGPLAKLWGKEFEQTLKADSLAGHLFLIHTGADCGGPIDILLDEEIPLEYRDQMTRLPAEFLLRAPTGKLLVGGVEDYRSSKPKITNASSEVQIPIGDYAIRSYVGPEENFPATPTKRELKELIGEEDFRYYSRIERQGCLGYLTLLLFPALWPAIGWKVAGGLTILVVLGYFYFREVLLRKNERYRRIKKIENDAYVKAGAKSTPLFVFQLRKLNEIGDLKGGSIDMSTVRLKTEKF